MTLADPFSSPSDHPQRLQYLRAWTFAFESPQWALNLLFGVIASLIPVIGPLLLYGYQFEIVEGLHREPRRHYPDFDFSRFADYLVRGVWVFLVWLIFGIVLAPIYIVLYVGWAVLLAGASQAAGGEEAAGMVFLVGFPLLIVAMALLSIPFVLIGAPMAIRAGLSQDFATAFDLDWTRSFIAKTWREMLLGTLFLAVTTPIVAMLGALLCCVGIYPAMVLAYLAQAFMSYQYYQLFLQRGGKPVPLKEPQHQGW